MYPNPTPNPTLTPPIGDQGAPLHCVAAALPVIVAAGFDAEVAVQLLHGASVSVKVRMRCGRPCHDGAATLSGRPGPQCGVSTETLSPGPRTRHMSCRSGRRLLPPNRQQRRGAHCDHASQLQSSSLGTALAPERHGRHGQAAMREDRWEFPPGSSRISGARRLERGTRNCRRDAFAVVDALTAQRRYCTVSMPPYADLSEDSGGARRVSASEHRECPGPHVVLG